MKELRLRAKKCKLQWLKEGDENTNFFHSFMISMVGKGSILMVDWSCIDNAPRLKGFSRRWRRWTWGYISTINFSVLINGRLRGKIVSKRGLCQGDHLPLFLYTILGDSSSCLIHHCNERNILKGFKLGNPSLEITHLQYTGNVLIFLNRAKTSLIGINYKY